MSNKIFNGDCLNVLPSLEENSIDTVITDPPYHLTSSTKAKGFMNQIWDGGNIAFNPEVWKLCLNASKPGSTLLAFGGTRTYHRLACAIEDAGWIIRDTITWHYAQGMPKSHDISKAFDQEAGMERTEIIGKYKPPDMEKPWNLSKAKDERTVEVFSSSRNNLEIKSPVTEEAKQWNGWGTALKPCTELIVLAMKPLEGTYTENAKKYGVAGLWIDGSRLESGRWTPNVCFSHHEDCSDICHPECPILVLNQQSGELKSGKAPKDGLKRNSAKHKNVYMPYEGQKEENCILYGDTGYASRFFYCAKATRQERINNPHPTVKPLALLKQLCLMTKTPTGGNVLDPFAGSGTTGVACLETGRDFIGIEKDEKYFEIMQKRIR